MSSWIICVRYSLLMNGLEIPIVNFLPDVEPPVAVVGAVAAVAAVVGAAAAVVAVGAATAAVGAAVGGTGVAVDVSPPQADRTGANAISRAGAINHFLFIRVFII